MRGPFKTISGQGTIPIIIGAATAATGHSQMLVRSAAVIICAIWLSLDVGIWISDTNWSKFWRGITFCASASFLCCSAMGIMFLFLSSTLEDQRADTSNHLTVQIYPELEVMNTVFSMTNGGSETIGSHQLLCRIITLVFKNNSGISEMISKILESNSEMNPGDSQSDACLSNFKSFPIVCADIVVTLSYQLVNQVGIPQEKDLRFVGYGDSFRWIPEPTSSRGTYCKVL